MFNVGDRVVCINGHSVDFNGEEGTVEVVRAGCGRRDGTVLHVRFDCKPSLVKEWYMERFQHADGAENPYRLVCRKIKTMEDRWKRFQEKKEVEASFSREAILDDIPL